MILSSALGCYAANAAYNIAGYAAIEAELIPKEVQLVELSIKELNRIAGDLTVDDSDDVTLEQLAQEIDELKNKGTIYIKRILNPFYRRF